MTDIKKVVKEWGAPHTFTVVLYDKEGKIQRAGCQLPGDRLGWLHLRVIVLGQAVDLMQGKLGLHLPY